MTGLLPANVRGPAALRTQARESQLRARARSVREEDSFLVTPARFGISPRPDDPTAVIPMTTTEAELLQQELFLKGITYRHLSEEKGKDEGSSEREIRCVLIAQRPWGGTQFRRADAASMLPGGAPLIDHLLVRLESTPDWARNLPAVEMLRARHRLPDMSNLPTVKELTLGVSSDRDVKDVMQFMQNMIAATTSKFGICQLGTAVQSLRVARSDIDILYASKPGQPRSFRVVTPGEPAENLPVRLMFGHVGWQIHIRLPVKREEYNLCLTPGELQEGIPTIVSKMYYCVGIGITEEFERWFKVVEALYGRILSRLCPLWFRMVETLYGRSLLFRLLPPMTELAELVVLARLAGYNLTRHSLDALNWIVMGTLMPMGISSDGDFRWHEPWSALPAPLQAYLVGEVSQTASAAWVLTMCWLVQLFPDRKASGCADHCKVLVAWQEMIINGLGSNKSTEKNWKYWHPLASRAAMVSSRNAPDIR